VIGNTLPPDDLDKQAQSNGVHRTSFPESFGHAIRGLLYVNRTQRNWRIHIVVSALVYLVGLWLRLNAMEFALLTLTIGLVLISEVLNTALEAAVDVSTQEFHTLAKVAKDVAAGGVLLASILAVVVGVLVFLPHLLPFPGAR